MYSGTCSIPRTESRLIRHNIHGIRDCSHITKFSPSLTFRPILFCIRVSRHSGVSVHLSGRLNGWQTHLHWNFILQYNIILVYICRLSISLCNSGSNKWSLAIWKNSVPQWGVKPRPLTNWVSSIPLDYWEHWSLAYSPLQGESMSSYILNSEITLASLATKCNSGSNKWHDKSQPHLSLTGRASYIIPLDYRGHWCRCHSYV